MHSDYFDKVLYKCMWSCLIQGQVISLYNCTCFFGFWVFLLLYSVLIHILKFNEGLKLVVFCSHVKTVDAHHMKEECSSSSFSSSFILYIYIFCFYLLLKFRFLLV